MPISELSALLNGTTSSAGITGAGHHRNQASRRSRYSAQARASELAGAKQAEAYPQNTCAQTKAAAPCTYPAKPHHHPGIMQKPGIPAQQMQRTGTRASWGRSGTGQNPLVEHAHTAPQPCSIAWEGGGHAAMKGGTPWSCERASGHVPASGRYKKRAAPDTQGPRTHSRYSAHGRSSGESLGSGARMSLLFTGKKPRGWPRGCAGGGTLHFTSARAQIAPDRPHPPSGALPHWGESDSRFFLPQFTFTFSRALDPNSRSIHA